MSNEIKTSVASIARKFFCQKLISEGYTIIHEKSKQYADIVAKKGEHPVEYYEIKATTITESNYYGQKSKKIKYFGAATLTELNLAVHIPDRYKFVIIFLNKDIPEIIMDYRICSISEIIPFMTIPPFKFNFNIPICMEEEDQGVGQKHHDGTVIAVGSDADPYEKVKKLSKYFTDTLSGDLDYPKDELMIN